MAEVIIPEERLSIKGHRVTAIGTDWIFHDLKMDDRKLEYATAFSLNVTVGEPTRATLEFMARDVVMDEVVEELYFRVGDRTFKVVEEV